MSRSLKGLSGNLKPTSERSKAPYICAALATLFAGVVIIADAASSQPRPDASPPQPGDTNEITHVVQLQQPVKPGL